MTNDLTRPISEHKEKAVPGFTRQYGVDIHGDINDATAPEKQIKGWNRAWKIRLIEKVNPVWNDLAYGLL